MNIHLQQLYKIAAKQKRLIIGLMSGTSLDGLDVALCSIENSGLNTNLELLYFETVSYNDDFKQKVKDVFSKKNIDFEKLCLLNPWIALQHAQIITECLQKWNIRKTDIDLIASHGQTVYHAPQTLHRQTGFGNATLQIGDGDHLAIATGIITVSDFRQKHIAAGGEGAPLALYGDYILFSKEKQDRVLLNIGGITNFTFLPGSLRVDEIICTDIGPGNTMMDAYIQQNNPGKYYDESAVIASKGEINNNLLYTLKNHPFFSQPFPKTTGPELFNLQYLQDAKGVSGTLNLNTEDTMATLNRFTADIIIDAFKYLKNKKDLEIYISGGGVHNPLLIFYLKKELNSCRFYTTEKLGINPDAKEAVLFAVLANECICGNSKIFDSISKNIPAVGLGKISFPG